MALCYKGAMNKALPRLLLTCLLAIALPLKGLAASSMLACGPDHHSDTAAVVHGHDAAAAPAHALEHESAAAHAHDHGVVAIPAHAPERGTAATPLQEHAHGIHAVHEHVAGHEVDAGPAPPGLASGNAVAMDQAPDLKDKSRCGTCAPCCVSAALTGSQTLHIAQAANSADFPAFAAGHASPPAGRLDRPPRSFHA